MSPDQSQLKRPSFSYTQMAAAGAALSRISERRKVAGIAKPTIPTSAQGLNTRPPQDLPRVLSVIDSSLLAAAKNDDQKVIFAVCAAYGCTTADIWSKKRPTAIAFPRQV